MKKPKQKKTKIKRQKHKLKAFFNTAGFYIEPKKVNKWILTASLFIGIIEVIYLYYFLLRLGHPFYSSTMFVFLITPLFIGLFFALIWLGLLFYLDWRTYQRKIKIEEVLPDFLHLTAANIRAGMPIDQALWYSIRPKFGVLAKEMEMVAKEVMSGSELSKSLKDFSEKYDSQVVRRSISLLLVGMEAGGEIGELLNQIAIDIQENRLMRKEMVASVQTYIIFISFATVIAAPILMGLALQLLTIVTNLTSEMDFGDAQTTSIGFNPGSGGAISVDDFQIFAYVMLTLTSLISALLIAIIKKGNIIGGLKYLPRFIITSLAIFYLAALMFGRIMSGITF